MSEYAECSNTFTETEVRSKEFVHTWKINNFTAAHPGDGEAIEISKKINNQILWHLWLYPDDQDFPDYVGIHVSFYKTVVQIECFAYLFRICILDKNKKEHEVFKLVNLTNEDDISVDELVKKDYLFNEKNELLENGNLILRCRIYFPGEIVEKPISSTSKPKHSGFENIFNKQKFSDVKIIVGEKIFWAYKGILSTQSPVFLAMFEHNMKESNEHTIEITDIDQEVVQEMLRFIYVGKVDNIENTARDLLAAADKYEIDDLKLICEETLISDLKEETVVSLLVLAEKHGAKLLKENAIDFFKLHAKEIVKNEKCKTDCNNLSPVLSEIITTLAL